MAKRMQPFWWFVPMDCNAVLACLAGFTQEQWETLTNLLALIDARLVLEGDYSDWTIYDSFNDTSASSPDWCQYAVVNKDETVILLIDAGNLGVKKYTIATKTLGALVSTYEFPGGYGYSTEGSLISIHGTYVVALKRDSNGIAVWKNGDLIKTMTFADLGFATGWVYSVSISKSGKYIIVSGMTEAGNYGWVVLVGS